MNDPAKSEQVLRCKCCIAGGGPAGMMLGFLLARAGVDVIVLEKHADFLRDFRGDTIHPSTLEIMHELGVLDDFLKLPHQELTHLDAQIGDAHLTIADFSRLPTRCKVLAFMPQWDFLNFIAAKARRYSAFRLLMEAEATALLQRDGRVTGLLAQTANGTLRIEADLCVGADGRHSIVREKAGLEVIDFGAPMDALWMRISKQRGDPGQTLGRIVAGKIFVSLDRGDYWQCAYVIPKGAIAGIRERGLPAFRDDIAAVAPFLRERVGELRTWDDIKLLTVKVDRLRQWHRPGLLCIGDAAHAMSPIGGVGINLAVQDAVAAANILAGPLVRGNVSSADLEAVQQRREFPTRMTQRMQLFIQNRGISRVLASDNASRVRLPLPFRLLRAFPQLRGIPARLVGLGFRPEHVKTPDVGAHGK
jgi:2-polyprenyl-6-methoxyphenol hydroxylase-like FAD-dependent oxidoreductase